MQRDRQFPRVSVGLVLGLALLSLVTVLVPATSMAVKDGRINEIDHVGGNVIYCIDGQGLISEDFTDGASPVAGIRILDPSGNILMFVQGLQLAPLVEQANAGLLASPELVASAPDQYGFGQIRFFVLPDGRFELTGFDEHFKFFFFRWTDCDRVTAPGTPGTIGAGASLPSFEGSDTLGQFLFCVANPGAQYIISGTGEIQTCVI